MGEMGETTKRYTCTEVTLDMQLAAFDVRLWIGTAGLVHWDVARAMGDSARAAMRECDSLVAHEVVEHARSRVPFLNAVQVRNRVTGVGVMAYTQPFEDNDRERFGL